MENQPYLPSARAGEVPKLWPRHSVVSRVESFTAADLPIPEKPSPVPAGKPAQGAKPVRAAKVATPLVMMKAMASSGMHRHLRAIPLPGAHGARSRPAHRSLCLMALPLLPRSLRRGSLATHYITLL